MNILLLDDIQSIARDALVGGVVEGGGSRESRPRGGGGGDVE